jgi:hypothetical protein
MRMNTRQNRNWRAQWPKCRRPKDQLIARRPSLKRCGGISDRGRYEE